MIQKVIKLAFLFFSLFFAVNTDAQMVVNTTILPPYSPYLSDYVSFGNKVVIMVSNPTPTLRSIKLMGSITGNGISIKTSPNFMPSTPIIVQPMATIQVMGNQLAPYYNTDNLSIQGISVSQLVNGNGLPEGTYTFCYYAADYNTGAPLSNQNSGCATITISHHEPSFLIQPMCDSKVSPKTPQNLLFSWTVPAGVNPINIEYELTVVELLPNQNPTQALNAATEPVFFRKTVPVTSYLYSQVNPQLTKDKKYAWRVRAKPKPGKNALFKNNGYSAACSFEYKTSGGGINPGGLDDLTAPPQKPNYMLPGDDNACVSGCELPAPANTSPYSPKINDTISIGKFAMIIKTINGNSGTGTIQIPFMKVKVAVDFTGLQVNTDKQAYGSSKAIAHVDGANLLDQATATDPNGTLQMTRDKYNEINNYVTQGNRLVSKFSPGMQEIGVPFAFDKNALNLQIVGLIFTPTQGYLNSIFGYDLAESFGNEFVDFSKKGLCIRPNGYGIAPKFTLAADKVIALSDYVDLKFLKGDNTYMELDCDGIKAVKLSGEYLISREKLLPVENDKIVQGNSRVKVPFSVNVTEGANWMFNSTMVPSTFTVPDAQDFRFKVEDIVLDMHNNQNPTGLKFHPNHPYFANNNPEWKGLYIGNVTVTFPDGFKKKDKNISFGVEDLMIDKTGFWAKIESNNVLSISDGSVGNWQFSISTLNLNIEASALAGGSMEGDIKIPIAETGLGYTAAIQKGNNGTDWQFGITLQDNLEAKLWVAKLQLEEGSSVTIEKENNVIKPIAILNGNISIGFDQSPNNQTPLSKLALNGIKFQELKVTGGNVKPEVDLAFVSLESQPEGMFSMNKFPINLTALSYDNGDKPGISFGLKVNLSKGTNAFEAETNIKVKAKWNGGAKKFEFEGIELQKIAIDCDLGVIAVKGSIELYKDDPTYGTGFRGDMEATLKFASVAINATIQLGKIGPSDQPTETGSDYRYFFIDIGARWGVGGLPIPGVGAIAFYGFGGGVYRNMDRVNVEAVTNDKINNNQGPGTLKAGETRSGVIYTPKKGTFGFMASVTIGTTGEPTSFNADVKLTVQFNTDDFGITKLALEGDAFIMGPIADRDKRLLKVGIDIELDFEKPMFHAAITIDGGFNQSALKVTVKASLTLHFEPGIWYVKLGEWTNDDEPWNDPKRIQVDIALGSQVLNVSLNFNAYFMMGTDIGDLPRSPLKVRQALGLNGNENPKAADTKVYLGKGFAMGVGMKFDLNAKFLIFYANLEFILGADLLLSKSTVTCNGSSDYGINGWYAKGIAYAYLHGDVGLELRLFGVHGKFSLLEFTAAAQMRAELPNPNWVRGDFAISGSILNGLISVKTKFSLEVGEKCVWGDGTGLELPMINELLPEDGTKDVSVFEAPQASFNYQVNMPGGNKTFTLKDFSSDPKGKSRKFKLVLEKVELARGLSVVPGKYHLNNEYNGLTFIADNWQEGEKEYKFTVVVNAYEKVSGSWKLIKNEPKFIKYTTGKRPDYIPEENVVSAFPQLSQRYYLSGDNDKADIYLGSAQDELLAVKEDDKYKYTFKMRLTNLETKNSLDFPFTQNGKHFNFAIPTNLQKETVYQIRMIRIATPKSKAVNVAKNTKNVYRDEDGNVVAAPTKPGNKINDKMPMGNIPNNGGGGINPNFNISSGQMASSSKLTIKYNEVKERQASGKVIEKELFKYYFRTSKHSTAAEKFGNGYKVDKLSGDQSYLGNITIRGTNYTFGHRAVFPLLVGQENMDLYEAYGYYKENFDIKVEPLAKPEVIWGTNSYYKNLDNRIYNYGYKGSKNATANGLKGDRYSQSNYSFFGIDDQLFSKRPIEAIKMWNAATEGPINLNGDQKILVPKGRLSSNEINKAKQGQKIVEQNPKNPVLPVNIYLGGVALNDAAYVFEKHKNYCFDDYVFEYKEEKCIKSYAVPALTFMFTSGGFPNNNPYSMNAGDGTKFSIKYGYYGNNSYKKELNFNP